MEIIELICGPLENNTFLLTEGLDAYLIDAPYGSMEAVEGELEGRDAKLRGVLMTHGHWDHMGDLAAFQKQGMQVWAHPSSRRFIENPSIQSDYSIPGIKFSPAAIDVELREGVNVDILNTSVEVFHIPGHSQGSAVLYLPGEKVAFVGDVIFRNSIGRTDLPGGNHSLLLEGIAKKLYSLPNETTLYPGHGPITTIGYEKKHNPFVKG